MSVTEECVYLAANFCSAPVWVLREGTEERASAI